MHSLSIIALAAGYGLQKFGKIFRSTILDSFLVAVRNNKNYWVKIFWTELLRPALLLLFFLSSLLPAHSYTRDIHRKSVVDGAQLCVTKFGVPLPPTTLAAMIDGVLEPDQISASAVQILKQRIEPGSYGKQRKISPKRIAAQFLHGSPNPTRPIYRDNAKDTDSLNGVTRLPEKELLSNRFPVEIYSYDTNKDLRNRMLIAASQYLCVSLAHVEKTQAGRALGNLLHMIGDTYSASHVQRQPPEGSPPRCGTEKIEWHFSMDLVSWKQHAPADKNAGDWRFRCLVHHIAKIMDFWANARENVNPVKEADAKRRRIDWHVRRSLKYLCNAVLREDKSTLNKPTGGAPAGYSSASGTDNWNPFSRHREDLAIQPEGLTSKAEAEAFYDRIAKMLKSQGGAAEFSYPSRDMEDLCKRVQVYTQLPAALACTPNEIEWAMTANKRVQSMWLPSR
jgi:hypothetical protein